MAAEPARPLQGQHAVVTGGGTGIGAAVAQALAQLGARLTLIGRRPAVLEDCARRLGAETGASPATERLDVTDPAAVAQAFTRIGPAEILVNNAGAAQSAPFARTGLDLLDRMLAANLKGAFLCTQAALPAMLQAGHGRIVNIASTAGLTGYAYVSAYVAAKHALVGLTRALALETAKSGVTVNAVCPGFTDTELVDRAAATIAAATGRAPEAAKAELARSNPMGRLVTPEEVAGAVAFLVSREAGALTGQTIVVAGGELMP